MSSKLPPGHPMSAHKDEVGQIMHRWKHHDPKALHSGRGKGGKEGKVAKSQDQAIAIALSMAGKSKGGKGKTSNHAERLMSMGYSEQVAQEVSTMLDGAYDFTRCERPNGTSYGTAGKCRKGVEAEEAFRPDGGVTTSASGGIIGGALFGKGNIATTPGQDRTAELVRNVKDKDGAFRKLVWPSTILTPELKQKLGHVKATLKAELDSINTEIQRLQSEKEGFLVKRAKDNSAQVAQLRDQGQQLYAALAEVNKKLKQPRREQTKTVDFSEDALDFTTCERPNGSHYGTDGKCRKGTESEKEHPYQAAVTQGRFNIPHSGHAKLIKSLLENAPTAHVILGKGDKNVDKDFRSQMLRAVLRKEGVDLSRVKIIKGKNAANVLGDLSKEHGNDKVLFMLGADQEKFLNSMGKATGVKTAVVPRETSGSSSSAIRKMIDSGDIEGLRKEFGDSPYVTRLAGVARKVEKNEFSEDSFDFTTCERPNGSRYGTGGKCRRGKEVSPEEKSAVDKLARMIPKGGKIVDSAGKTHTTGGSKLSKHERIAAEVMSDRKFNSDRKRVAEMIRRGVPANTDFISLVADAREKLGGTTTDTIRSLVKEMPKRRAEEDMRRPDGQLIGTSPRNMSIDGLADLKKEAEDYKRQFGSRSGEETIGRIMRIYEERIKAQEQYIMDKYGND